MRTYTQTKGWYSDITLEGDYVSLIRDSHITVNGNVINLPGENVLFLICKRYNGKVLLAGQGHQSGNCWFYDGDGWEKLGTTFATFPCAFSPSALYFVSGPNQYRIYDLDSKVVSDVIPKALGSQGIRYIDFDQTPDGIVTGDSTYGPTPFNLSQWTRRDNLVLGQSYDDGGLGLVLGKNYHKFVKGSCEFIRFYKRNNNLAFVAVDQPNNYASFFWMTLEEFELFPIVPNGDSLPVPEVITTRQPGPINMSIQASNKIEVVKQQMRVHPEIDLLDEDERGDVLDYVCAELNKNLTHKVWGRKARNKDGSNKNTDGLTYLRTDDRFEIIDVISGRDPLENREESERLKADRGRFATWDHAGIFSQGENGYWAPANPVSDTGKPPIDDKKPEPEVIIKEVIKEVEVIRPRVKYEEMMQFVSKVSDTFADTKLGKNMNALPEHTQAHILWRYFFEHESYSDEKLLEEVRLRGNEEWRD